MMMVRVIIPYFKKLVSHILLWISLKIASYVNRAGITNEKWFSFYYHYSLLFENIQIDQCCK